MESVFVILNFVFSLPVLTTLLVGLFVYKYGRKSPLANIPGPKPLPIIGNAHQLLRKGMPLNQSAIHCLSKYSKQLLQTRVRSFQNRRLLDKSRACGENHEMFYKSSKIGRLQCT